MLNRITVQLPVEGLLFWKLSGREAMSESYALTLTLLGTDARLDRSRLLGQPVTVTIPTQNLLTPRYINGKVTRVAVSAVELTGTRYAVYQLTVEPDLWPMKRDRNLRIFQGQTVPQIVKTLLGEHQVNLEDKLTGSYRVWDYCVQYQESSLDFISRLMELEGIAYYFSHEADKHTLVLTDAATQHQPFSGYEAIPYHQTPSGGSTDEEGISQWALEDSVTPGIYSLDDYDFRKPNAWLFQAQQNPASPKPGSIDVYDWPGRFVETGHAEFYARIRQERWQVEHQQIQATATAAGIAPGHIFTLTNAPFFSDNGEYLVTAAGYHFEENRYASGEGETIHRTDFTVIPAAVSYRPAQSTAWPRTYGPQTAKVVGPQGESIWTDKYGRVKVKFHWDRLAKGDDTSSCWVRVSSAWAGQGYGGVQIPRVGDEVVVDFINGDPDRPIITGRVYNEASMPPWALPAAATQMGFMSRTKDGSVDNANALRFEDKAGAEQVWIQAERNMDTSVKNDETHSVGGARSHYVKKNELHRVEANQIQAVKGGTEILTGKGKLDAAVEQYVIASGTKLRLVSGESAIELNANGKINLIGKEFNFFVEGDGYITTGGKLHLNTSGTKPGTTAPGSGHKGDIDAAVQEKFAPGKESKAGAAASAPAETSKTATPPSLGVPSSGYGKDVDGLVDKSPTMKNDIATLKKRGWTFEEGEAGKGTFANRQKRVITVDKNELGNPNAVVQSMSHESGHALYEPNIDFSSRDAYLNSTLSDEGAATLNNIRVQREIIANKGGDIGIAGNPANQTQYNRIYDSLERGAIKESEARTQIGRIFGKGEQTSTTGQYYEDYYGGWYDKNYP
ncbi:type VI secretion system tip protein VgrG [Enterobacter hormaechei subsp. hoffmannii]|uniref:type VI secretion system Vgr family protein n=4 Tax=Enterobacter hormaechei TaxID=158836 RepID=UPI002235E640|nr:type VI secretion system tip protein VgrG [Enterobacter hormaechei]EKW1332938.1 type VI secretion system tip protein VgrG [Enterobacter hormaechei]MCU2912236.1 type VI secretion system tip protein VgrG [Enterobacter hormaechei subsp. hoffmannii]MCU2961687.1 type VI secretion system tip protein VgrG [Enterobacter hormaechei subsp. hoffmannii]MCW4981463.1 type VI secretion system tip protein VgrG [Enterobacter hormaechei subsp. hoffmannii]MEC5417958.1 type VI secretion system tip protein VgrG